MLPLLLAPALSSARAAFNRYQAELGATAILIAAERHRQKTGDWPASIAAIDHNILPNAPLDPFTGKAFLMLRHDGQVVIYSVGPNLDDEQGATNKNRSVRSGPDDVSARAWDVKLRHVETMNVPSRSDGRLCNRLCERGSSKMTLNPYASDSSPISQVAAGAAALPAGLWKSTWRALKRGARLAAFVGGPLSLLFIIPAFVLAAFGVGSDGRWALPRFWLGGLILFIYIIVLGAFIGGVMGFVGGLIGRVRKRRANAGKFAEAELADHSSCVEEDTSRRSVPSKPAPRTAWLWITAAGLLVGILIASVIGFQSGVIVARSVESRLEAAIAAADRDDPNWRLDDLLANRVIVLDEENSANVMDQIVAILPEGWLASTKPAVDGHSERLLRVKEAFDAFGATPENVRLSDPVANSLRVELKTLEEAVAARSLKGFRGGRHELEIGPTIIDTPLQQTQDARSRARLLCIDAAMRTRWRPGRRASTRVRRFSVPADRSVTSHS